MVADLMNQEYNGYKKGDPESSMGNFIRMSTDTTENVGVYCGGGCYEGKPDCKVSGSIFNYKQMVDQKKGTIGGWYGFPSGADLTGFYVNSSLIKTKLGKCLYAWDGATDNKVNSGCGGPATGGADCKDKDSAYYNQCDGQNCTAESPMVSKSWCTNVPDSEWPQHGNGARCFWKGVAFDTTGEDSKDETHDMLDWRTDHQDTMDGPYKDNTLAWNELILDGHRMLEALDEDPAATVLAMVYSGSPDTAKNMAEMFQKKYKLDKPVPIIFLDTAVDVRSGDSTPWVFKEKDQPDSELMV